MHCFIMKIGSLQKILNIASAVNSIQLVIRDSECLNIHRKTFFAIPEVAMQCDLHLGCIAENIGKGYDIIAIFI